MREVQGIEGASPIHYNYMGYIYISGVSIYPCGYIREIPNFLPWIHHLQENVFHYLASIRIVQSIAVVCMFLC